MSIPDYPLDETIDFKFTSRAFATGIPTTLAGTPVVEIYEDNSVTQITGAETLSVDFDSVTGLNNLRVAATAANGFEVGKSYAAVLSAGTVGGVSVVGEVVAQFSIQRAPGAATVTADEVNDRRTWFADGYRARNTVEVLNTFNGTLSLIPDINPDTSISTVDSVSITGAASVTADSTNLAKDKRRVNIDVPALATIGTYKVVVTVTTIDGDTIPTTAALEVH